MTWHFKDYYNYLKKETKEKTYDIQICSICLVHVMQLNNNQCKNVGCDQNETKFI